MSEVELIDKAFSTRVDHVKLYPIDHKAYEESQNGVLRLIDRKKAKLVRAHKTETRDRLKIEIEKLKLIDKYLQKALEA